MWLAFGIIASLTSISHAATSITCIQTSTQDCVYVGDTANSAVRVLSVGGGGGGTSSTFGAAFPATGTAAGFNDGVNMQGARVLDLDTGAGTEFEQGVSLRCTASGGSTACLPATFTSADAIANQTASVLHGFLFGFNGATWDRLRSSIANGLVVDVSRVLGTVTVTGTITANQGSPATTANRWPVQLTDGTTLNTFTGSSVNVNCTGGCGSASQAATYTAEVTSSASAATKDYLSIFNASGSGRVLRIVKVEASQGNTAAVAGLSANLNVIRTSTAGATCTAVTVQNNIDTNNAAVPAQVTAATNCTTDPTLVSIITHCSISVEETTGGAKTTDCYRFENNGGQPITLREGEGLMIRNTALAPVGLLSVSIEFRIETT